MARSQCAVCMKIFSSLSSFDRHRIGSIQDKTRRCMSDDAMLSKGMIKTIRDNKEIWTTEGFDASVFVKGKSNGRP